MPRRTSHRINRTPLLIGALGLGSILFGLTLLLPLVSPHLKTQSGRLIRLDEEPIRLDERMRVHVAWYPVRRIGVPPIPNGLVLSVDMLSAPAPGIRCQGVWQGRGEPGATLVGYTGSCASTFTRAELVQLDALPSPPQTGLIEPDPGLGWVCTHNNGIHTEEIVSAPGEYTTPFIPFRHGDVYCDWYANWRPDIPAPSTTPVGGS